MTEITGGGGVRPPPSADSRADSMACAMTDRQTLAEQRRSIADTANIKSLRVVNHVLLALDQIKCLQGERTSGGTDDG
jgi:hypothetical protein